MALVTKAFSDIITYTRSGNATYFNSAGNLVVAGANVPRLDFNPSTLAARGLLIEEQRTNSVANNTMVGAVAGTPGTQPTGWNSVWITAASGVTPSIVGVGTVNGINYIDWNLSGTWAGTTGTAFVPQFSASNVITAAQGQTWAEAVFVSLISGSLGDASVQLRINNFTTIGTSIGSLSGTAFVPTGASLASQRQQMSWTLPDATTGNVAGALRIALVNGSTYNFTLRIGLPQLENNNISTGVSTATVASGGIGYTNGDTLTVVGGTGTAATLTVTGVSGGAVTTVSVATAGSYSVFPTSPVSVTGGTGTLATFNLTPVSQTGFSTSVIQTSGAAATRSADQAQINTLSPWFNAAEGTLVAETPAISGPGNSVTSPARVATFSDGTNNNRIILIMRGIQSISGGVSGGSTPLTGTGLDAGKRGWAYKLNDAAYVKDGGTVQTTASFTVPVTMSQLVLGSNSPFTATVNLNGCISRLTYYPRRLSNAELQAITT